MIGLALWIFCMEDDLKTPPSHAGGGGGGAAAAVIGAPTPGEKISLRQAELLTEANFVKVFGTEVNRDLGVDWSVFSDPTRPFDDGAKRDALRRIKGFLRGQLKAFSGKPEFEGLRSGILDMEDRTVEVHEKRLEAHATEYFRALFPGSTMHYAAKTDGDQLGAVAIVTTVGNEIERYYIKTHASGLKSIHSAAAEVLSAIELMVYQILFQCGFGSEPHFFGRDERNFYIATKDANQVGRFVEFSKIKASPALQGTHWGCLTTLDARADVNAANHAVIESAIAADPIAQNFIQQVVILDFLARMMQLEDLQTNGTNFGFISGGGGTLTLLRIIDFRFSVQTIFTRRLNQGHFDGLLEGNSSFPHLTADKAMCYALRNRPEALRVAQAREVWAANFLGFCAQVDESIDLVTRSIRKTPLGEAEKATLVEEANTYGGIVKHNWEIFDRGLSQWRPEGEAAPPTTTAAT